MQIPYGRMCGIVASFNYGAGPGPSAQTIVRIRDAMAKRGPDGAGYWCGADERVQLAHRRLSIIDTSGAGAQPLASSDRSFALTFNGEIYNYRALRSELERGGYRFQSAGDAEVILALYSVEGTAMLRRLRGMFAFALWDQKRQGLLLARDPFGIKPLYYADDGRTFLAASQVKAILASHAVNKAPDPAGHVGFMLWGHIPEPHTLYRAIRSLPAGTSLWIDRKGGRTTSTFCNIKSVFLEAESNASDPASNSPAFFDMSSLSAPQPSGRAGLLNDSLRDSVRHHLVADVPVGIFLSSGIDSTAIAALAVGERDPLQTVTLGFEEFKGTSQDETTGAMETARRLGTQHHTLWVSRQDFEFHCERLLDAMDQPSIDGVNTYFISLAASRLGLKAALSGIGGDELFAGYPSFRDIPAAARWLGPARWCGGLGKGFRVVSGRFLGRVMPPKYAGVFEYGGTYSGAYLLRRGLFMPWELPSQLDPMLARTGLAELEPLLRIEETVAGLRSAHLKVACLESTWYLRNQLLRDADWAGMAHSVEIRVPFVDVALLHRVASLVTSGWTVTKRDLARACGSALDCSAADNPKRGFFVPLPQWLAGPSSMPVRFNPCQGFSARAWARFIYTQFVKN